MNVYQKAFKDALTFIPLIAIGWALWVALGIYLSDIFFSSYQDGLSMIFVIIWSVSPLTIIGLLL